MLIGAFFRDVLDAKLNNTRTSWGARDRESDRLYLRVWEDQLDEVNGIERVRVDSKSAKLAGGRHQRRRHIEEIREGVESYGVVCRAKDPDTLTGREIRDFDEKYVLKFGDVIEDQDSTFLEIIDRIPVSSLGLAKTSNMHLMPGDTIKRTELHKRYGGQRQGGVGPSAKTPNVFLFSDPDSGEQHGYYDGWQADGCFHYTGEGQRGDQELVRGNRAILNASTDGRAIHLFSGTGGNIEYLDQFVLDETEPFYLSDAPETLGGPIRSVIIFRLIPVRIAPKKKKLVLRRSTKSEVKLVPVEEQHSEKAFVDPNRPAYEAERRESSLVQRYKRSMEEQGYTVARLKMKAKNEAMPMFTDVYIESLSLLVEAKGSIDRQSIRMAIGQLMDYRRFVDGAVDCAVLLPSRPRDDLIRLLKTVGVRLIYEDKGLFLS